MSLSAAYTKFDTSKEELLRVGHEFMQAAGGNVYPLDLLALAAINRTLHLQPAFRNAVDTENFLVVGPLLRLHVDTCLRFFAAWITDSCQEYASQILSGTPTYKLRDSKGNKMTDTYLHGLLSKKYPWVTDVYEACSGFVHLSRRHVSPMMKLHPSTESAGMRFEIAVGLGGVKLDHERYVEAVKGFNAATGALLDLLRGWSLTKENPHLAKLARTI